MAKLGKNEVYDKKTGKKRKKDMKLSRAMKKAAKKRVGRPQSSAMKAKIRKGVLRAIKTGKTSGGRRVRKAA